MISFLVNWYRHPTSVYFVGLPTPPLPHTDKITVPASRNLIGRRAVNLCRTFADNLLPIFGSNDAVFTNYEI